jgi:excisionase family DNA binding protein
MKTEIERVVIVNESVFDSLLERILKLEQIIEQFSKVESNNILTVNQVAMKLCITPETVREKIRNRQIEAIKVDLKSWGVYESQLEKYLKRHNRNNGT